MVKNIEYYTQKLGIELFVLLILGIILELTTVVNISYYIDFKIVGFIASALIAITSYYKLKKNRDIFWTKIVVYTTSTLIIVSNIFLFEYIGEINPLLYTILLGQFLLIPYVLYKKNQHSSFEFGKYSKILLLIIILALSFFLRVYTADTISPGRDSYHHFIGAKSINDFGSTVYETLPYINYLLAFLFNIFGESLLVARMPFIIAGSLSIVLIYLIGKKISSNVGIISAILLGVCPWAIGLSRYVRDYSFNLFITLLLVYILLTYPKKIHFKKEIFQFIGLAGVLCLAVIVIARYQKGLTISIVLSLLTTIMLRLFFELEILEKIKSIYQDKKILNNSILLIMTIFTTLLGILTIFEFYLRLTFTYQPKWFFFFLTEVNQPMLWYSLLAIPAIFIIYLFIMPLFQKKNKETIFIVYGIFLTYFIFFVFLAKPHSTNLYARYIYVGLPFFILILSVSLERILLFFHTLEKGKYMGLISVIIGILLLFSMFSPRNTYDATIITEEFLNEREGRNIISIHYREYDELIEFLESKNFSNDTTVILSELRIKDVLGWEFDYSYSLGRNSSSFNRIEYDIGDNMYIIEENVSKVIYDNPSGWIIRRDGDIFPLKVTENDLTRENAIPTIDLRKQGIDIIYYGMFSRKYEVYYWNRTNK